MSQTGLIAGGCWAFGLGLIGLFAKMLGPLSGPVFSTEEMERYEFIRVLTFDAGLMGDEQPGDVLPDGDGLLGHLLDRGPQAPLPGAVVDQVLDPVFVQAEDGAPEELFISSTAAVPFIREPVRDTR